MRHRRTVDPYNPHHHAATRWPEWTIRAASIAAEIVIYPDEYTILISDEYDQHTATAQAVAHLDLDHHNAEHGPLSDDRQAQAAWLAEVRLDPEGSRPAVGGNEPADTEGEQPIGE